MNIDWRTCSAIWLNWRLPMAELAQISKFPLWWYCIRLIKVPVPFTDDVSIGSEEKKATGHALDWGVVGGSEPPRIFLKLYIFGLEILKCTSWKNKIKKWVIEINLYINANGDIMDLGLGSYGFEHLFLHWQPCLQVRKLSHRLCVL